MRWLTVVGLLSILPHAALATAAPKAVRPPADPLRSLAGIPVGLWSEYRGHNGRKAIIQRFAIVGRTSRGTIVETEFRESDAPRAAAITTRAIVPDGARFGDPGTVEAIQVGTNPPMQMPEFPEPVALPPIGRLTAEALVGTELTRLEAGVFKSRHYHHEVAKGHQFDVWLCDSIYPVGVLKTQLTDATGMRGTTEFVRQGGGAKPRIKGAPLPFDKAKYMQQMISAQEKARQR